MRNFHFCGYKWQAIYDISMTNGPYYIDSTTSEYSTDDELQEVPTDDEASLIADFAEDYIQAYQEYVDEFARVYLRAQLTHYINFIKKTNDDDITQTLQKWKHLIPDQLRKVNREVLHQIIEDSIEQDL